MKPVSDVYNEDCMGGMKRFPDKFFDLAIVDIEYGIGASKPSKKPHLAKQKNGSVMAVQNKRYTHKEWDFKMSDEKYFNELLRVSKDQIIFGGNYYGLTGGYLVWDKLNGNTDQFGCELAWLSFTKRTDVVYFKWSGMIQGKYCSRNIREAISQQGNKELNEVRIHPTQKPVALYNWILTNYSKQGYKICDTHLGSQSSRISAYKLGFDFWGWEIDEEYFDEGNERFRKAIAEPLFESVNTKAEQAAMFNSEQSDAVSDTSKAQ